MKIFLVFVPLLLLTACYPFLDKYVFFLRVQNNSGTNCAALYSDQYPDTTITADSTKLYGMGLSSYAQFDNNEKWEKVIARTSKDTISFFIFSWDTIHKYGWQNVRDNYRVLKRYDVDAAYLKAHDWTITYP